MVVTLIYQLITKPEQINKTNKPVADQPSLILWLPQCDYSLTNCQDRLAAQVHMANEVKGQYGVLIWTEQPRANHKTEIMHNSAQACVHA